jgi:hypothetical protein
MVNLTNVACGVGGTPMARKVIVQSGYQPFNDIAFYARPLRPVRQTLTHQRKNWKLLARLTRNIAWTLRSRPPIPAGWTVEPIAPGDLPESVLPRPSDGMAVAVRSPQLITYMAECPITRHQVFLVKNHGEPAGYFVLSFTPGQARICDGFVNDPATAGWAGLFAAAVRAALDEGSGAEITASSSLDASHQALEMCGFRRYRTLPIMLFDEHRRLASVRRIHLQMIDNDFSFLHEDRPEYHT